MATGQTQEVLSPQDGLYQSSYPVSIVQDMGALAASFPSSSEGWLVFDCVANNQYGGGSLNVEIVWISPGNSGVIKWSVSIYRMYSGLVFASPAWGSESSQVVSVPGVAGTLVYTTLTLSSWQLGGLKPGEMYQLRLRRDVSPPTNSSSAAEFLGAVVSEG
jgi:hypothetical protein